MTLTAANLMSSPKLSWMNNPDIRPYVFVRPENKVTNAGALHKDLPWFKGAKVLYKNPLDMHEVGFADRILSLEAKAFAESGMAMPRWVFYDCAIMPGFVAGYAARTASLDIETKKVLGATDDDEWTALSLFIVIPTMAKNAEWVAHNLCSVNSLLPREKHFYGIGFMSKAFGLWYANVRTCCGVTQWMSPSVRLHAHYGDFEVLTAFTPVHSYSKTLTYRVNVDASLWHQFFTKEWPSNFEQHFEPAGIILDPKDESSLKSLQTKLQDGEGPFFLSGKQTMDNALTDSLTIYRRL